MNNFGQQYPSKWPTARTLSYMVMVTLLLASSWAWGDSSGTVRQKPLASISPVVKVRDLNGYCPVWDDPNRGRILCVNAVPGSRCTRIYYTTDGISFTKIADRTTAPFSTLAMQLGVSVNLLSIVCLPNGWYLISAGKSNEWVPSQGPYPNSRLYLSKDGGATWTAVCDMKYGYVAPFGWSGISGSNIVIGEYGPKTTETARGIYASYDSGETWAQIYDIGAMPNRHIHCAVWDPTSNYTRIFYSCGDEANTRGIYSLVGSGTTWSAGNPITTKMQPTNCLVKDNKIYWSADNSGAPAVNCYDPADDSWQDMLVIPLQVAATQFTQYEPRATEGYYYHIRKCGNLYYLAGHIESDILRNIMGIYVSPDLEHWAALKRLNQINGGYLYIGGVAGGQLYVGKNDGTTNYGEVLTEPTAAVVQSIFISPTLTNYMTVNNNDSFELPGNNFYGQNNINTTLTRTDSEAKYGTYSLRADYRNNSPANTYGIIKGPQIRSQLGYTPAIGTYLTAVCWVKPSDEVIDNYPYRMKFFPATGTVEDVDIDTVSLYSMTGRVSEWRRFEVCAKVLSDFSSKDMRIGLEIGEPWVTDAEFYIDGFQLYASPNMLYQLADFDANIVSPDMSVVSLTGLGNTYAIGWRWWPLAGCMQYQTGAFPIGRIEAVDGSYIDIYWKDNKYYATNGITVISSTEMYYPHFYDCVKFGVAGDLNGSKITINDPLNGEVVLGDGTSCGLTAPPAMFKACQNTSGFGYGAYIFDTTIFKLLNPKSNEKVKAGSALPINWQATGNIKKIRIECSTIDDSNWQTIDDNAPNIGTYTWQPVPSVNSPTCRIRISDNNEPATATISADFTIFECNESLTADLNGDCLVNLMDFAVIANQWLTCADPPCPEDFDDLATLASQWLECGAPEMPGVCP